MGNKTSIPGIRGYIVKRPNNLKLKCISIKPHLDYTFVTFAPTKKYKGHIFAIEISDDKNMFEDDAMLFQTEDVVPKVHITDKKKHISYETIVNNIKISVRCDERDNLQEIVFICPVTHQIQNNGNDSD